MRKHLIEDLQVVVVLKLSNKHFHKWIPILILLISIPGIFAWNSTWDNCTEVTIKNPTGSTLTNFPLFLNITDSDLVADREILTIIDSECSLNGSVLDFDIDNYDATNFIELWVEIGSLPSTKSISILYNNNTPVSNSENEVGTWNSNYKGVWHLNETGNGTRYDSTSNNQSGTPVGYDGDEKQLGKIGGSDHLDGTDDVISIDDGGGALNLTDDITIEGWLSFDNFGSGSWYDILGNLAATKGYALRKDNNNRLHFTIGDGSNNEYYDDTGTSFTNGQFYHVAVVFDNSGNTVTFYRNGVLLDSSAATTNPTAQNSGTYHLGKSNIPNEFDGVIDEIRVLDQPMTQDWVNASYQFVDNQGTFVSMSDYVSNEVPNITLTSPSNTTYWRSSIELNFTVTDADNSTFTVQAWNNTDMIYNNTAYSNGTALSFPIFQTNPGLNFVKVRAWDSFDETNETLYYTMEDWDFVSVTPANYSEQNETSYVTFEKIYKYNPDIVNNITSGFNWLVIPGEVNPYGLIFGYNVNHTQNTTHVTATHIEQMPFMYSGSWFYPDYISNCSYASYIYYNNGSSASVGTSILYQNLTYAYFIDSINSDATNYLEGEDSTFTIYARDYLGYATLNSSFTMLYNATYNTTSYDSTSQTVGAYEVFEKDFNVLSNQNNNETRTVLGDLIVSFGGHSRTMEENKTVNVYKMIVTECGNITNTTTFIAEMYNEKDFNIWNGSIDAAIFTLYSGDLQREYRFSNTTENETFSFCLYPTWANPDADIYIEYKNSESPKRPYYVVNTTLSSTPVSVRLYILNSTYAAETNIYTYDYNSYKLEGYYPRILKFNTITNAYETMFTGKTDSSGIFTTFLEPLDQPYKIYILDPDGEIYHRSEDPEVIQCLSGSCPPYEKHIYTEPLESQYVNLGDVQISYDWDSSTRTVTIDASDETGIVQGYWIKIDKVLDFGIRENYKNTTVYSSTINYQVVLPNTTEEYNVQVFVMEFGEWYPIKSETVTMEEVMMFGTFGILISLIMIIALEITGLYIGEMVGGVVGAGIGLFLSKTFRLVPIPVIGLYSVLCVAGIFAWYFMRGD